MFEEIQKLPHRFWLTSDEKTRLFFKEVRELTMVEVHEYGEKMTKHMYILYPTLESNVFAFDTPNGHFLIGISSTGEELFLSPMGVFLYPYGKTGCHPQSMSVNSALPQTVNDIGTKTIN